jgi:hypothetical protein
MASTLDEALARIVGTPKTPAAIQPIIPVSHYTPGTTVTLGGTSPVDTSAAIPTIPAITSVASGYPTSPTLPSPSVQTSSVRVLSPSEDRAARNAIYAPGGPYEQAIAARNAIYAPGGSYEQAMAVAKPIYAPGGAYEQAMAAQKQAMAAGKALT